MENPSLQIGNNNWAVKDGSILGYNIIQDNYLPQPITFTRASTATRVNADGLIERVRTNLYLRSNEFNLWSKSGTFTVTANDAISPDGTLNADRVEFTASHNLLYLGGTGASGSNTLSVYAKAKNGISAKFRFFSNGNTLFSSDKTATGEWQRFTFTYTYSAVTAGLRAATTGADDILFYGFQQEVSDFGATEYIPTTTTAVSVGMLANVPRIDYTGGGFGKLLLEPQRTNSLFYSEQFDNAAWTKGAVSVTANNAVSPDGYTNADLITADGTTTQHYVFQFQSAAARTYSIFLKMGTQRYVQILTSGATTEPVANYDLQNGVANMVGSSSTASIENYGNGWYRCILSTTDAAAASFYVLFASSMTSVRYEVNNSSGTIWAYGAQAEVGSYATSYIPATSGVAVTRVADAAYKTGISSLIGQTEGVLFVEMAALVNSGIIRVLSISDGTSQNRITIEYYSVPNYIVSRVTSGNVQGAFMVGSTFDQSLNSKFAVRYALNDCAIFINGIKVDFDLSVIMPISLNSLRFDDGSGGSKFEGKIRQLQLFKTALTDEELITLTTL
jgi:hypothetical protein